VQVFVYSKYIRTKFSTIATDLQVTLSLGRVRIRYFLPNFGGVPAGSNPKFIPKARGKYLGGARKIGENSEYMPIY
jgi:hypothetical protein